MPEYRITKNAYGSYRIERRTPPSEVWEPLESRKTFFSYAEAEDYIKSTLVIEKLRTYSRLNDKIY